VKGVYYELSDNQLKLYSTSYNVHFVKL